MGQPELRNRTVLISREGMPAFEVPPFARDVGLDASERIDYQAQPPDGAIPSFAQTLAYCHAGTNAVPTRLRLHAHQGIEVGLVLAGEEEHQYARTQCRHGPGDVWLYRSWEPHAWRIVSPNTTKVVLIFLPEFLGDDPVGPAPFLALFAVSAERRPTTGNAALRERVLAIGHELAREIAERPPLWPSLVRLHLLLSCPGNNFTKSLDLLEN